MRMTWHELEAEMREATKPSCMLGYDGPRVVRRSLTCAVEEFEHREKCKRSVLEEYPDPWCDVLSIVRVERDCQCGLVEQGWVTHERLLHGCNTGTVIPKTEWDGCPCGRGKELWSGRAPLIVGG